MKELAKRLNKHVGQASLMGIMVVGVDCGWFFQAVGTAQGLLWMVHAEQSTHFFNLIQLLCLSGPFKMQPFASFILPQQFCSIAKPFPLLHKIPPNADCQVCVRLQREECISLTKVAGAVWVHHSYSLLWISPGRTCTTRIPSTMAVWEKCKKTVLIQHRWTTDSLSTKHNFRNGM